MSSNPPALQRVPRSLVTGILVLVIGMVLSVVYWRYAGESDQARIRAELKIDAEHIASGVDKWLEEAQEHLEALAAFYRSNEKITRENFKTFAELYLGDKSGIQAVEWIPRVPHLLRDQYEVMAREDGIRGFEIRERDVQGKMVRRADVDEYFPVYFIYPVRGNEAAIGFDLGSHPVRKAALERARDTGDFAATEAITLVQEKEGDRGFLIFKPIYEFWGAAGTLKGRRNAFVGAILGVFRISDVVSVAIPRSSTDRLDVFVYDETQPGDPDALHAQIAPGSRALGQFPNVVPPRRKVATGIYHEVPLDVAGRKWLVLVRATPVYIMVHSSPYPKVVLLGSLILTLVLAFCAARMLISSDHLKEINTSLAEAQSRYMDLYENAPVMYATVDIESGDVSHCNQTLVNRLGIRKENIVGRSVFDLYHPDSVEGARLVQESFVNTGKTLDAELQLMRHDGSALDVNLTASAVRDAMGNVVQSRSVFRDVTRQKKAEAELLALNEELEDRVRRRTASHARLATLVGSTSDAVMAVGLDGVITDWNDGAEKLFLYTREEAIGQNRSILFPGEREEEYEQIVNKLRSGGVVQGLETVRLAKGGIPRQVSLTVSLIRTPEGEVTGLSAIIRDIADQKRAEQELIAHGERLRELTAAMSESLEVERQRIAQGLHDEIGQLLTACHYRIAAIGAATSGNGLSEDVRVLEQLLTRADEEIRELTFELRSHTLSDVGFVEAIEELCEHFEERFSLHTRVSCDDDNVLVPQHLRGALYQAVRELLLNVVKHSGQDQARIFISNGGENIHITVEDSGNGFTMTERDLGVSRSGGFGLFHMSEQISHLGGKMDIRSVPGDGTSVMLEVPLSAGTPAGEEA